jgi:hypothetical protein
MAAIRRFSITIFSISVSLLQVINRTSLGTESGSPAIPIVYYMGSVLVDSRTIIVFLLRSVSV